MLLTGHLNIPGAPNIEVVAHMCLHPFSLRKINQPHVLVLVDQDVRPVGALVCVDEACVDHARHQVNDAATCACLVFNLLDPFAEFDGFLDEVHDKIRGTLSEALGDPLVAVRMVQFWRYSSPLKPSQTSSIPFQIPLQR